MKKGTILFLTILGLIVITAIVLNSKRASFGRHSTAKFSPAELTMLFNNYSINNLAGECADRKFVKFEDDKWQYLNDNCTCYKFYFSKESENNRLSEEWYKDNCEEGIFTYSNTNTFFYFFKQKNNYSAFLNDLLGELKPTAYNGKPFPDCMGKPHYLAKDILIIDDGYDMNDGYYYVLFTTKNEAERLVAKLIRDSTEIEKKRVDSIVDLKNSREKMLKEFYTNANASLKTAAPHVFHDEYLDRNFTSSLSKGDRVRVIEEKSSRLYCDYISEDKTLYSAWFNKSDIIVDSAYQEEFR